MTNNQNSYTNKIVNCEIKFPFINTQIKMFFKLIVVDNLNNNVIFGSYALHKLELLLDCSKNMIYLFNKWYNMDNMQLIKMNKPVK